MGEPGDPKEAAIITFPPRRIVLLLLPVYVIIGALAGYAAVQAVAGGEGAVAVPAGAAATAALAGVAVTVRVALARARLTGSAVIAPRVLGRRTIPLTDIAGIGLHYASAGNGSGWRCFVWPAHGPRVALSVPPPSHTAPKGTRSRWRTRPGVAPAVDWDYVAGSPAGRAAIAVAERVSAVQGPRGPWATMHRETAATGRGVETAFWSPTGASGPLPGARVISPA